VAGASGWVVTRHQSPPSSSSSSLYSIGNHAAAPSTSTPWPTLLREQTRTDGPADLNVTKSADLLIRCAEVLS
jgi:hypothetical protein